MKISNFEFGIANLPCKTNSKFEIRNSQFEIFLNYPKIATFFTSRV